MKSLIAFPLKLFRKDTGCLDRILALLLWIVISPCLCTLAILPFADWSPDEDGKISRSEARHTQTAIFLLTNSPTPSDTPTDTYTPTDTDTPTNTPTPSDTYTPSDTPTDTDTPTATYTPTQTFTPSDTYTPSDTPLPTQTPRPSPVVDKFDKTLYAIGQTVNIRACASTNCDILGTLSLGQSIKANGIYQDEWYRFEYENGDGWVHESVVSTSRPATNAPRPTSRPATQRPQSTIPPVSDSGCPCNQGNTLNCPDFSSQSSAQACYNKCIAETGRDVHGLDSGGVAGVACENN